MDNRRTPNYFKKPRLGNVPSEDRQAILMECKNDLQTLYKYASLEGQLLVDQMKKAMQSLGRTIPTLVVRTPPKDKTPVIIIQAEKTNPNDDVLGPETFKLFSGLSDKGEPIYLQRQLDANLFGVDSIKDVLYPKTTNDLIRKSIALFELYEYKVALEETIKSLENQIMADTPLLRPPASGTQFVIHSMTNREKPPLPPSQVITRKLTTSEIISEDIPYELTSTQDATIDPFSGKYVLTHNNEPEISEAGLNSHNQIPNLEPFEIRTKQHTDLAEPEDGLSPLLPIKTRLETVQRNIELWEKKLELIKKNALKNPSEISKLKKIRTPLCSTLEELKKDLPEIENTLQELSTSYPSFVDALDKTRTIIGEPGFSSQEPTGLFKALEDLKNQITTVGSQLIRQRTAQKNCVIALYIACNLLKEDSDIPFEPKKIQITEDDNRSKIPDKPKKALTILEETILHQFETAQIKEPQLSTIIENLEVFINFNHPSQKAFSESQTFPPTRNDIIFLKSQEIAHNILERMCESK